VVPWTANLGPPGSHPEQFPRPQPLYNDDDSMRCENEASGDGSAEGSGGAFDDYKFHSRPLKVTYSISDNSV
jgi:hypothetical protein